MKKTLLFAMLMVAWCGLFAQHTITINLTTDKYGSETTWQVKDVSNNSVIASGGPYSDASTATVQTIPDITVDGTGCYVFTIYDSYGDGICCSYGQGSYSVLYDGTQMGNGGQSFSERSHFLNPTSSSCASDEISLVSLDVSFYQTLNSSFQVKGKVANNGLEAITSYVVRYRLDGGAWSADYTVSCNIATFGSATFTHDVPASITSTGHHTLEVEVSNPNGNADNVADNTISMEMIVNENSVPRKPLLEHFSTAQCSNCPAAHTNIDNWLRSRPNVIHIVHHCGYYTDNYTVSESQSLMTFYNAGGSTYAPAIMIDRMHLTGDDDPGPVFFPAANVAPGLLDQRLNAPAFISVNMDGSYDPSSRTVTLTVSGETVGEVVEQNLRLSVYIMEDGLIGTQAGASGNYTHNCVMRGAISGGGAWGDQNVVSATVGSTYSKTYTYQLNSSWNVDNLTIIAFVNNHETNVNNRAVLNANSVKVTDLTVGISENNATGTAIFPNPATDVLNVISESMINQVEIYNVQGQLVKAVYGNVDNISISDLNNGMYFVKVTTDNGTATHKMIKK
ncbi:MAG: Omp28-related outer membrane protein [Bacteroidales bacterium]|nr:Omp28-related outer membrane protein [Bacteroidales bacterium]